MFIKTLFIFTYSFIASLAASPYGGDNNYYYPTAQQSNSYSPSPSTPFLSTPDIIDNEVVEAPLIHCTDRGVEFSIKTKNTFRGNIYVQGQFGLTECRREFYNNDAPQAGIEVRLNDCGMIRERRPHGMSYSIVLIVNFHPRFVTRVDRAFKILCSYQHTERPVGTDLEVGTVPTEPLLSDAILVPDCEYSMRLGDPNGPIATNTVRVGELIFHRWECQDSPIYGMLVKNCRVFDGGNENVTLIDERGCPTKTGVIQSPPIYSDALNIAYAPIFAFHFPDRTQMNFRCQIQSCNKMDNECNGLTPPNCPNSVNYPPPPTPYPASQYPYGQQQQPLIPQNPPQGEAYANYLNNPTIGSTPPYSLPTYIGAGISPTWPPNALPLGSVLQGNPSQVLQGIGRPWPANMRRRVEKHEGQSLEHKILLATQQLMKQNSSESWPPKLMVLNKLQHQNSPQINTENARRSARRFFNPVPAEAIEQDELRLRQRRAEEKTQDVVAVSTVTNDGLQGMDWSFENGKERIQQRRTMPTYTMKADKTFSLKKNNNESLNSPKNSTQQHQLPSQLAQNYCLNRSTLAALVGTIGLLSTILLAISCCLLWDFLSSRQRCRKGLINWRDSSNKLGNGKNGCLNFLSKNKISAVRNISLKNRYQLSPSFSSPISIDPLKPEGGQEQPKLSSDPREALAQILNRNHNKLDK
uniref:ZP domain-containing protein n=1 Tax=Meloidogyne enterolobii TaxID=390850 RepID=A0A6V7V041_MELEN|nr:unnamed protein product [Meloidogyne enterolobii]